jgi:cytidylate kinase
MPTEIVDSDTYATHMNRVIKMTALHGKVIFVGRGAQFFLPRDRGLRVRLIADEEDLCDRICELEEVDARQARKRIKEKSVGRAELVRRYFGKDISDPLHYDLILNSSMFSFDQLAELVLKACALRGLIED